MDDVVAVRVTLPSGEHHYFVTWGRVQDHVDPRPLADLVLVYAQRGTVRSAVGAEVCRTLQEAKDQPYFFEALVAFSRKPAPADFERWRADTAERMSRGKDIYYLGDPSAAAIREPRI